MAVSDGPVALLVEVANQVSYNVRQVYAQRLDETC
jgi:hypothetical protein